jgi:hypothetical protein
MSRFATDYLLENYAAVPEAGCWLWLGGWNTEGYGKVSKHGKMVVQAHRMFYEIHKGPIPSGMLVCHKCDTPSCVNPEHLFLGNHVENALDMVRKGRGRPGGAVALPLKQAA